MEKSLVDSSFIITRGNMIMTGIFDEVLDERDKYKLEVEELKNKLKEGKKGEREIEELTFDFISQEELDGSLKFTAVALAPGEWKNVIYTETELKKLVSQYPGKPILVEHGNTKEFEKKQVGTVLEALWDDFLHLVKIKGKVTDPEAIQLMKDKVLKAVSSSTWMEKIPVSEHTKIGIGLESAELSLVREPACELCFVTHLEELSKLECKLQEDEQTMSETPIPEVHQEVPAEIVPEPMVAPEVPEISPPVEQAKFVCPVDDQAFDSLEAFKEHWKKEHESDYGEYEEQSAEDYKALHEMRGFEKYYYDKYGYRYPAKKGTEKQSLDDRIQEQLFRLAMLADWLKKQKYYYPDYYYYYTPYKSTYEPYEYKYPWYYKEYYYPYYEKYQKYYDKYGKQKK